MPYPRLPTHQPDIVIVDIMMPRLDGYQTCSLIKHNKVFKQIRSIMLSSKDALCSIRPGGRIVGSEHYLTKPFTKDGNHLVQLKRTSESDGESANGIDPYSRRLAH